MVAGAVVLVAAIAAAPQTFKVAVEGVRVDVLVTEGRRIVAGLTAADFELTDSGVAQAIESVSLEDAPLSVMLVLDTSASVRGAPLAHLKEAASAVVDLLQRGDRAALATFSGAALLECDWTGDRRKLHAAIDQVEAGGATALHDAVYAALMLRDPSPGRPLVLVFSDGADTASWLPGARVVNVVQRNDAVVYAVTLGGPETLPLGYLADFTSGIQQRLDNIAPAAFRQSFIESLADQSGGVVVPAGRSSELRETFVKVVTEFRSRYVLTYMPRGVEASGWHPLEVRVKKKSAKVTVRRGYLR
ncbi:MAG TPA: VWA domain-containing protein [Vicinamibacterales bacterium]|nr:VWA domain-containing protein [Vicinamibacterales bacterium]